MSEGRDIFRRGGSRGVASPTPRSDGGERATLSDAAERINAELVRRLREPMTFSPEARERLAELHAEYLADLGQEAVRVARRAHVSTVDELHVRQASTRLGMGRSRGSALETAANTFGGVFAGAGIASVYALMFTPGPHGIGETAAALVLSVIGFVLLAIGLTVTFLRRSG
jgi:histone H3/H4